MHRRGRRLGRLRLVAEIDVDRTRIVDRGCSSRRWPRPPGRPSSLPRSVKRRSITSGPAYFLHRVATAERLADRHRDREHRVELLDQHVVVELRERLALERFGVGRQQLAEEFLLRRLGPADQLHALVEVLHQRRQLHQELLAEHRRALGLHAHHEIGADPAIALGTVRLRPVAPRRQHQGLAPHMGQELLQILRQVHRRQRTLQLQHVALLHAQLRLLGLDRRHRTRLLELAFRLPGDEGLELPRPSRRRDRSGRSRPR